MLQEAESIKVGFVKEMPLTEHLEELRRIVIRILVIVALGFAICYGFSDQIALFLMRPLESALKNHGSGEIVFLELLDKLMASLQLSFWCSLILTSPLWFREIWSFVKPGLYDHEVKAVRPFFLTGFLLFILGVLFGLYVVFPLTFEMLLSFGVKGVTAQLGIRSYLVLVSKVLVLLGIVFQLPNALLILGFMGLVTKQSLRKMRSYVYVGLSIFSAIMTPPDPLTMMLLFIPLVLLYEVGILAVALIVHPFLARQVQKSELKTQD